MSRREPTTEVQRSMDRRKFLQNAAAGTVVVALGGALYRVVSDDLTRAARAEKRGDGRPRLPPGQTVIEELRPMGGEPGVSRTKDWRLEIHGEVQTPITMTFDELCDLPNEEMKADVHCVTAWSLLGAEWTGVQLKRLAKLVGVKDSARHVIFEGAHGYTSNIPIDEALAPNVLIAHRINGKPLARKHGAPVRALVPDLYFWKSAKWLTGIRFVKRDEPGYWETRGYHNHADPWLEERYG